MSGREILQRDLDAAGHAVAGLPHAATGDAAERHDDVVTQVAAEATARAAADALIPGTITALTAGDGTASGTGAVPFTLTNLPQAVLLARLAVLTADPSFNARKLTSIGDGVNPQDAVAFHQLGDALAGQAFTVPDKTTMLGLTLGDGSIRYVSTYRDLWRLDKSGTSRTIVADEVEQSTVNAAWWWIRLKIADPYWAAQWIANGVWIDPAGTNTPAGSDEADGSSGHPIKSMAEIRRRCRGARLSGANLVIHPLSSSTNDDDGIIDGITTFGAATVVILGATTVLFSGTLSTGTLAYSGNTRGVVVDSSLTSWTASGGVSTTTGSRFIRTVGGGKQALIIRDLGSTTAMIGLATTTSETTTSSISSTLTSFSAGDAYEVVTRLQWPRVYSVNCSVRVQCLDIKGSQSTLQWSVSDSYVLCGFLSAMTTLGNVLCVNSLFMSTLVANDGSPNCQACSFVDTTIQFNSAANLNGDTNVFVNTTVNVFHGGYISCGNMLAFDNTSVVLNLVRLGRAEFSSGSLVGSGNSGKLISVSSGSYVFGASVVSAVTTDPLPYQINGVSSVAPDVDDGAGAGIYN